MTPNDEGVRSAAAGLAALWAAPVSDVEFPTRADTEGEPGDGWTPPEGYWSADCPPKPGPIVLVITDREQVSGVVPGDGVVLVEGGAPHSVGIVTQLSQRGGATRVVIENVRPIPEPRQEPQ